LTRPVFRFAPSPNGLLHLGHAYSALLNRDLAETHQGRLLLRIDDVDLGRSRPEFAAAIEEDCAWLGLNYERPVRHQHQHLGHYSKALDRLREMGLAYPAFMSRADVAQFVTENSRGDDWLRDPDGSRHYPDRDREMDPAEREARLASGEPHAVRFAMNDAIAAAGPLSWQELQIDEKGRTTTELVEPSVWGDVLLAGRDIAATYHLAVVIDDDQQGVTHVVRGDDLKAATSIHRLLQKLLGLPEPHYHHHRLILDADGRKLSKTDGDTGLAALRARGWSAAGIRQAIGLA
jgi:glutamyl-Q tRNA(Asp) synthetase